MGQTVQSQKFRSVKGASCNSADKTASKVSNINTYFIECVPKTPVKISNKKIKHVDNIVNSIETFTFEVTKALPNPHNNPITTAHCYRTNSSTSYCVDQDLFF